MKKLRSSVLWIAMVVAFLSGLGFRSVLAQRSADTVQSAQELPPDVLPSSLGRIPWPTLADCCPLGTEEEKKAFQELDAGNKPPSMGVGGLRRYFPLASKLYTQYRQMLRTESKLEPRYHELAAVVGARETRAKGIYREWFIHARGAREEGISEDILEVIRLQ